MYECMIISQHDLYSKLLACPLTMSPHMVLFPTSLRNLDYNSYRHEGAFIKARNLRGVVLAFRVWGHKRCVGKVAPLSVVGRTGWNSKAG